MCCSKKCVIVLSGGLDSAVVAYWAKNQGYQIYPLTFKYGQIADKEIMFAQRIAETINTNAKIVDLSALKDVFYQTSALVNQDIPLTSGFTSSIIVPFRNAIFLSVAVAHAVVVDAVKIFYGAHGSDELFYPDCRREFYEAFEKAAKLGTEQDIAIYAPYSGKRKSDLVKSGVELKVPFELTWSCYLNGDVHCGQCESCFNRRKAFYEAGVVDPTEYENW
ncbi:MAG: 7-cyano-7-deazaguanine synthase QueC [Candidatus Bathyarchaeota archaeon]|nr:7-cyano-7-deazaguanine synthase QueC [Candidatus Termiticorpusculum sp.]